jgi:ATPase subunit of ABC transporter with duplicated ATPase domains
MMADMASPPLGPTARVLTRTAGWPALLRAVPAYAALAIAASVLFSPNGMRAVDLLRVAELIALVAALKQREAPAPALIERLGVTAILGQRLGSLSLGQRRRACLLAALTGDPDLLVLDEPTNGLDRDGIALLVDLLAERAASGLAAVVATHDRAFIDRVATAKVAVVVGRAVPEPG